MISKRTGSIDHSPFAQGVGFQLAFYGGQPGNIRILGAASCATFSNAGGGGLCESKDKHGFETSASRTF